MENFHAILPWILTILAIVVVIVGILSAAFTVDQNNVAIVLRFGKFIGMRTAGLNFKVPFIDTFRVISLQNVSSELKFQAITQDQANVYFSALIIFSPADAQEETLKKVAFTFASGRDFAVALSKTLEGMVRSYIAGKPQTEILGLRTELVNYIQEHIKTQLQNWGYIVHDVQLNDITFDNVIMESMSKVVASANLKAAATNEGDAIMIQKTKLAQAEGNSIKISAAAEKEAAELRGQGVASFRRAVAAGLKDSLDELKGDGGAAMSLIGLSMYCETIKHVAENGKQNSFINLDGSPAGFDKTFKTINTLMSQELAAKN